MKTKNHRTSDWLPMYVVGALFTVLPWVIVGIELLS